MNNLTKKDIIDLIKGEIESSKSKTVMKDVFYNEMESTKFKKLVKNISKDVLEDFHKTIWVKRDFWKSNIK